MNNYPSHIPLPVIDAQPGAAVTVREVIGGYVITVLAKPGYGHQGDEMIAATLGELQFKLCRLMDAQRDAIIQHFQPKPSAGVGAPKS